MAAKIGTTTGCSSSNPCRGTGVGPSCSPADLQIDDPDHSFAPDGTDVPTVNEGDYLKKKCLDKIKKDLEEYIRNCTCDCLAQPPHGSTTGFVQGYDLWCWADCYEKAIGEFDFTDCFCREVTCGGGDDDDSDTPTPVDPTPTDPDPDPEGKTTYEFAQLGPQITSLRTQSSYDAYVPKVYNRSVTAGNIIWAGNARKSVRDLVTQTISGKDVTVLTTTVTQTFVDVALALCEGPIAGVARIWFNNKLIYNNIMDVDEDGRVTTSATGELILNIDNYAFFDKIDNADKYQNTVAKITIFTGSEEQQATGAMFDETGFACPGYRGLAYLYIENLDLTHTGGDIPEIRVDIVERTAAGNPTQVATLTATHLTGMPPSTLLVDTTNRLAFTGGTGSDVGFRVFAYDDLSETAEYVPGITSGIDITLIPEASGVTDEGFIFAQNTDGELQLINALTGTGAAVYPGLPELTGPGVVFKVRLEDSTTPLTFALGSHRSLIFLQMDSFGNAITEIGRDETFATYDIRKLFQFSEQGTDVDSQTKNTTTVQRNLLAVVSTPSAALSHIELDIVNLYDSHLHSFFDPTNLDVPYRQTIEPAVWGGETQAVLYDVIRDVQDQTLVFFIRKPDGEGFIFKWNYAANEAVWAVNAPSLPPHISTGPHVNEINSATYLFIGADQIVYAVSLVNGALRAVKMIAEFDVDPIGGAQFYDSASSSITYITNASSLARIFVGRLASTTSSVQAIVDNLLARAGLSSVDFDTSNLSTSENWGYIVSTQSSLRSAIAQLMLTYGFVGIEDNYKLVFNLLAAADTEEVHHTDFSERSTAFERIVTVPDADVVQVKFTYLDIDKAMAPTSQTIRSSTSQYQKLTELVDFAFPLTMTAGSAIHVAERLYAGHTYDNVTSKIEVGPKYLTLRPGDYVRAYDQDGEAHDFRVESTLIGSDHTLELELRQDSQPMYQEQANVTSIEGLSDFLGSTAPFTFSAARRPLLMLTNPILDSQVTLGANRNQSLIFGGVDYRGPLPMPATTLYVEGEGAFIRFGSPTLPVQWGTVTEAPSFDDTSLYTLDTTETFVVRFTRTDATDYFVQDAALNDLLNDVTLNLILVNDELIQFQSYEALDAHSVRFHGLLRGRRGTEWAIAQQVSGGVAVAYSAASWVEGYVNAVDQHQPVTIATTNSNGKFVTTTRISDHPGLAYYAPANVKRFRRVNGDLAFTMQQRSRLLGDDELNAQNENDTPIKSISFSPLDDPFYIDFLLLNGPLDHKRLRTAMDVLDAGGTDPYIKRAYLNEQLQVVDYNSGPPHRIVPTFVYPASAIAADGVDILNDTLYVVVFESAVADEFKPRGHYAYREIRPTDGS